MDNCQISVIFSSFVNMCKWSVQFLVVCLFVSCFFVFLPDGFACFLWLVCGQVEVTTLWGSSLCCSRYEWTLTTYEETAKDVEVNYYN